MRRTWISIGAVIALAGSISCHAHELPELSGAELYGHFCASCHGEAGRGNGPVAKSLKSKVPDLTRIAARNGGVFPGERVRESIDGQRLSSVHGTRDMPVWGSELYAIGGEDPVRRARVAELVELLAKYLESIQVK